MNIKITSKKTRADYENYLNQLHPKYEPFMYYLCLKSRKAKSSLDNSGYGFILRKHDPEKFEKGFNEWKNN